MTSVKQIEANRRNALRSTGPRTEQGNQRASQNAVRYGLTAETVIAPLEDATDYQAFELAVTADYEAETAVQRELVLRLASLLWRLRRATSIETGLLRVAQRSGENLGYEENQGCGVAALFPRGRPRGHSDGGSESHDSPLDEARRFIYLADLDNGVFERLGRYEVALWRQVRQTLFTLEALRWRASKQRRWQSQPSWHRTITPCPEAD